MARFARRLRLVVAAASVMFSLCTPCFGETESLSGGLSLSQGLQGPIQGQSNPPSALLGKVWVLKSLRAEPVPATEKPVTLQFESPGDVQAGRLAGSGGCNRYFGAYQLNGDSIKIGSLGSTMMYCSPAATMDLEREFLEALEQASELHLEEGRLEIIFGSERQKLLFEPQRDQQ